jgi:FKBP-type peptidyl-prolyl cis-trans isomerase SlyD
MAERVYFSTEAGQFMQIQKECVVTIEYTVRSEDGAVIDSSDNRDPLSFIQGSGMVFPALEQELEGHNSGDHLEVHLSAEQAYGERDERLLKVVPREQFKFSDELVPGMQFKTVRDGEQVDVTLIEVNDETVTVDANSPLAGVAIIVDVVITEVRQAQAEELESGEVQKIDDIFDQEALKQSQQQESLAEKESDQRA